MGDEPKDADMAADRRRLKRTVARQWSNLDRGWRATLVALAVVVLHVAVQFA